VNHISTSANAQSASTRPSGLTKHCLWGLALIFSFSLGCDSTLSVAPQSGGGGAQLDGSLEGNYSYTLGGNTYDQTAGVVPYMRAGTFVADGKGHITSGTDDLVQAGVLSTSPLTGSYAIADDGTGLVSLDISGTPLNLAVTILSPGKVNLIQFGANATGAGQAVLQDTTALSAAPNGTFVFRLHSYLPAALSPGSVSAVGALTLSGGVVNGREDLVRSGAFSSLTVSGSFTAPDSTGRGTVQLTDSAGFTSNYIYRTLDSKTLTFLEADPGPLGSGRAEAQSGAPFSNAAMSPAFVFRSRGDTQHNLDGVNSVGTFTCDATGTVTSGSYDSVVDGVPIENASLTGTCSTEASGRATIMLNPSVNSQGLDSIQEIAWMVSSSRAFFLVNVSGRAEDGSMDQQQTASFSSSSLKGAYSILMFGYDAQNPTEVDRVGLVNFDGNSSVTLTNYFVNRSGSKDQLGGATGSYSVAPNGRVTASVSGVTASMVAYLVSGSSGDLILQDQGAELSGSVAQQALP